VLSKEEERVIHQKGFKNEGKGENHWGSRGGGEVGARKQRKLQGEGEGGGHKILRRWLEKEFQWEKSPKKR